MRLLRLLVPVLLGLGGLALPAPAYAADPVVTWPSSTRIGGTNPPYVVSVADPGGTGVLFASFRGSSYGRERLDSFGETTLHLTGESGVGVITVQRCTSAAATDCTYTDVRSPEVEVRTPTGVYYYTSFPDPVRPSADGRPDTSVALHTDEPDGSLIDWWVEGTNVGRSGIPLRRDEDGDISLPLDLVGLPTGTHHLRVRVTYDYPGFGPISSVNDPAHAMPIVVDTTGPGGRLTLSDRILAPYRDDHLDQVWFDLGAPRFTRYRLEVGRGDRIVRTIRGRSGPSAGGGVWDGTDDRGKVLPPGAYVLRGWTIDSLGNESSIGSARLRISRERLVRRTLRRTVTPAASVIDTTVGRCSRLARPAARGWRGSFGYYTDTRCARRTRDGIVASVHRMRVPRAARYGSLQVSVFGGAARSRPGSHLFLDHFSVARKWESSDTRIRHRLGPHPGPTRSGDDLVHDDRRIYWAVYTGGGAAYDVKSFTVTLSYDVLRRR
jgi:hypothetical protein